MYHVLKTTNLSLDENGKLGGVFGGGQAKTWTLLGGNYQENFISFLKTFNDDTEIQKNGEENDNGCEIRHE